MASTRTEVAAPTPRRPARDLIDAVVDNMRRNLEPLRYSTLAPSRFTVYLHPSEHARLEGILPILQEQTLRALGEELGRLNQRRSVRRLFNRLTGTAVEAEIRSASGDWHIEFLPDPDGDLNEGDLLVDSELVLPARPDLGVGERTRRITTVHTAHRTTTRGQTVNRTSAASPVVARLTYRDDGGEHSFDVARDSVTIGRGGIAYPVDVRVAASPDVSREHARIRRDPATGAFFLIDLSTLGTTLNGRHVAPGFDERDGTKRENGAETVLPDGARIGLADVVFLEFRRIS